MSTYQQRYQQLTCLFSTTESTLHLFVYKALCATIYKTSRERKFNFKLLKSIIFLLGVGKHFVSHRQNKNTQAVNTTKLIQLGCSFNVKV